MAAPLPALDKLALAMAATALNEFSPAIAATAPDVLAPARRTELATAARCPPRGRALPPSRRRAPSRHGSVGFRAAALPLVHLSGAHEADDHPGHAAGAEARGRHALAQRRAAQRRVVA